VARSPLTPGCRSLIRGNLGLAPGRDVKAGERSPFGRRAARHSLRGGRNFSAVELPGATPPGSASRASSNATRPSVFSRVIQRGARRAECRVREGDQGPASRSRFHAAPNRSSQFDRPRRLCRPGLCCQLSSLRTSASPGTSWTVRIPRRIPEQSLEIERESTSRSTKAACRSLNRLDWTRQAHRSDHHDGPRWSGERGGHHPALEVVVRLPVGSRPFTMWDLTGYDSDFRSVLTK
jgi:hypothetical protein